MLDIHQLESLHQTNSSLPKRSKSKKNTFTEPSKNQLKVSAFGSIHSSINKSSAQTVNESLDDIPVEKDDSEINLFNDSNNNVNNNGNLKHIEIIEPGASLNRTSNEKQPQLNVEYQDHHVVFKEVALDQINSI